MIWRAEDHTNTAKALALSQFLLENEAGQEMNPGSKLIVLPIALASCCDLAGPAVKKTFSGLLRAGSFFFPPERNLTAIYCVCKRVFVRTAAKSEWQLCPECQVKCRREKKTQGQSAICSSSSCICMCERACAPQGCNCCSLASVYINLWGYWLLLDCVFVCACFRCVNNSDSFIP